MALTIFANACKTAKPKSLFKQGFKTDPSNCRPIISLLLLLSKVSERIVTDQASDLSLILSYMTINLVFKRISQKISVYIFKKRKF